MAATATPRRTQAERTAATTGALLRTARELFAADGYAGTSLQAIADAAGVTKGALYHHFAGKEELFAAVYDREQDALVAEAEGAPDLEEACVAYLRAARDPATRRITLVDAPLALSVTSLRSTPMVTLLERRLAAYDGDVRALAQLLHGALREAALSESPALAHELRSLVRSLPV